MQDREAIHRLPSIALALGLNPCSNDDIRVRYQTLEFGKLDIHLRGLRDLQECPADEDFPSEPLLSTSNWSYFGVLWPSETTLAELMLDHAIENRRILEIGCGLALASLVLNSRNANISATDYHPKSEEFLEANVRLNNGRPIPFARCNWLDTHSGLGRFDLIIGSDLLYERGTVDLLAAFINAHARDACEVVLVDPGRGLTPYFGRVMNRLGQWQGSTSLTKEPRRNPRERILSYRRNEQSA